MAKSKQSKRKIEYGDFQTPKGLARQICALLVKRGLRPVSVLEPNCGVGNFLLSAMDAFPQAVNIVGIEIDPEYAVAAKTAIGERAKGKNVRIIHQDFFRTNWVSVIASLPEPLLVVGNPPWVTNAELGALGSSNLPSKINSQNVRGIEAITGRSNFDISEWMLIQEIEWISGRQATLAMLCKPSVARKALLHAWKNRLHIGSCSIHFINAGEHFGVSVDACLLLAAGSQEPAVPHCHVYESIEHATCSRMWAYHEGRLVSDISLYGRWKHLAGHCRNKWRSGIKHDCAKIMELRERDGLYCNGLGEIIDLEQRHLYPMLKSSDVANGGEINPSRWMLVTQHHIGDDTSQIRVDAPKTWQYLESHADFFDKRLSSIYHNRPRFAVFGVGEYSFAQWKVAVSGLYKTMVFKAIGPWRGKPVVFDDTCYFMACNSREEACFIARLVNSEPAREFLSSVVFWDDKRPVTIAVLARLDLLALAHELNMKETMESFLIGRQGFIQQLSLFS